MVGRILESVAFQLQHPVKKIYLLFFALFIGFSASAQSSNRSHELGLLFSNPDRFGITYRFGVEELVWRINLLRMDGGREDLNEESGHLRTTDYGFQLRFGKEYRIPLSDKLELRYGGDLSMGFGYLKTEFDLDPQGAFEPQQTWTVTSYTPGLNLVLGANYELVDKLWIGVEILPGVSYTSETSEIEREGVDDVETREATRISYGLRNFGALLSLTYRL